jgi:hypothetical protein
MNIFITKNVIVMFINCNADSFNLSFLLGKFGKQIYLTP